MKYDALSDVVISLSVRLSLKYNSAQNLKLLFYGNGFQCSVTAIYFPVSFIQ